MGKARLRRWMLASAVALSLALVPRVPGLPAAIPAFAAGACASNTTTQHYFSGWLDTTNAGWGSSAWITTHTPVFCTGTDPLGSNDFITAWSMIADSNSIGGNYAQSGWTISRGQTTPQIFSEYTYTSCPFGFCDVFGPNTTGGQNFQYWQDFDTCCNVRSIDMGYGSTLLDFTAYDPTNSNNGANSWPGPWQHQDYAETLNTANDMPGTATNPTSFTSVAYLTTINTSGAYPPGFTGITAHSASSDKISQWCVVAKSGTAFDLYTAGSCPTGTPS